MNKTSALFGTLVVVILLMGANCNLYKTSKTNDNTISQEPNSISIFNLQFSPASLSVDKGTTVTWTNNETTNHIIKADDGFFESGNLSKGKTFQKKFDTAGTYSYYCSIHPTMTGKIIVQ